MQTCRVCGKTINDDEVIYCLECGSSLCIAYSVSDLCPDCEEIQISEDDHKANEE